MSQKKQISAPYSDTRRFTELSGHIRVWYCAECWMGPWNTKIDEVCTNCGSRRSRDSREEWVPVHDISISPPRLQEPPGYEDEALPMTVGCVPPTHNTAGRASMPFDNLMTTMSSTRPTNSPVTVPYTLEQPHIIDTSTISSASTQPETHGQLAPNQWNLGGYESDLLPVPNHWSPTVAIEYDETGSYPINSYSEYPDALNGVAAQFAHSLGADNFEPYLAGGVNPTGDLASTLTLPVGITTDYNLPGWSEFSQDVPTLSAADSQIDSNLVGLTPLPWAFNDFDAWFPSIDHTSAGPTGSSASPPNVTRSTREDNSPESVCKHYHEHSDGKDPRLACPFSKYSPKLHVKCQSKGFDSIGHLKQHLLHSHKLGTHHCTSCWRTFKTAERLNSHGYCVPTGGKPVDKLPVFPKTRISSAKKWYWCCRQLFGEAAALPECPFYHSFDDSATYSDANSHELPGFTYVERGRSSQTAGRSCSDREHTPLSTSPDHQRAYDEKDTGTPDTSPFGLLPQDSHTASSDPSTNPPATPFPWDFGLDEFDWLSHF
ncbi:hypothetical protein F5Y14DRAFT_435248 [Nemania sp. NC0429]|nr:hypothetical protein F5Y14DRAFT_435248 [Nemania sp. NC0429]